MVLEDLPIKRRLRLVILLTSLIVLVLTSGAFAVYELVASRLELARRVETIAQVMAANSGVYLASGEGEEARDVLATLQTSKHILAAALYDTNNALFASFPTNAPLERFPAGPAGGGMIFTSSELHCYEPVFLNDKRIGTLFVGSSLAPIYDRFRMYLPIGLLVMASTFLVAFVLSDQLQRSISRPILELAQTARVISEGRDYSVRARKVSQDELGLLTDAFNHMLTQVQDREAALEEKAAHLRLALDASQTGAWDWNIQTNQIVWDDLIYRQFGLKPGKAEATYEGFIQAIHAADREVTKTAVQKAIDQRSEFNAEFRVVWPDGSVRHLAARGKATYGEKGRPVRMSGVSLDITERKKAEEAHSFLAAIVESSDDAIVGKDLRGTILSWNAGAEQMFGYTAQEIVGRPVSLLTSPDRPDEEDRILERIRAGIRVEHYETIRIRKDGQPLQLSLTVSPIRNAKGQIVGVSSIARDITERKRSEAAMARQAAALREQTELLDLANVLARDLDDRIILWTAGVEHMYGWSREEALGKVSHELLATEFPSPRTEIKQTLLRSGEWTGELIHTRRDKQRLMVASRWVLHRDEHGRPVAVLEVNNDITERKLAEEEVRRLNSELELRVRERTAELTEANNELEAFTYSVSHDLRAPLRHIDAFARIIEEDMSPEGTSEIRRYIARIRKGTQTMGQLVDDLLNLSRVGRTQLSRRVVDLNSVLEEVLADLKGETAQRAIEWHIGRLPLATGDAGLIKQVFTNLLSNAVKYTRPRTLARIEVGQKAMDNQTVVYVQDNGVGFDMKYSEKLFGVFERLHRHDEFEGTGIGLAIVRRVIQKHNGRVWADGAPDKGATFYFTLPGMTNGELPTNRESVGSHRGL
jgi:PAS domain S-box-containing protein